MSRKIKVEDAIDKIQNICEERNLNFLGFCNEDGEKCEWYGNTTKLILQCKKCGLLWHNTNYNTFTVKQLYCHNCRKKSKPLKKEEFIDAIVKKCEERNYEFLGYCNKDGEQISEPLKAVTTYLHLKCGICGNEWKTTTYNGFINCSQGCPSCKKINVISQTRWEEDELVESIKTKCLEKGYIFLGFCDKNGERCCLGKIKYTYLHLKCDICGNEWKTTTASSFLGSDCGCPQCKSIKIGEKKRLDSDYALGAVLKKCEELELNFLGFCDNNGNPCEYKRNTVRTHLKCKKCGNEWKSVTYHHLINRNVTCPYCSLWSLEEEVLKICQEKAINYDHQKRFDWLGNLSLDFYLPQHNIAIECQGLQHFKPIEFYGGEEKFKRQLERDYRKQKLCEENGIKMIYVVDSYKDVNWDISLYTKENTVELKDISNILC